MKETESQCHTVQKQRVFNIFCVFFREEKPIQARTVNLVGQKKPQQQNDVRWVATGNFVNRQHCMTHLFWNSLCKRRSPLARLPKKPGLFSLAYVENTARYPHRLYVRRARSHRNVTHWLVDSKFGHLAITVLNCDLRHLVYCLQYSTEFPDEGECNFWCTSSSGSASGTGGRHKAALDERHTGRLVRSHVFSSRLCLFHIL